MSFYEAAVEMISKQSEVFNHQMLYIMKSECDYYLENANRCEISLCGNNVDEHITFMKALYNSFPDDKKPEWISIEDINKYKEKLKYKKQKQCKKMNNYDTDF